MSYTLNGHGEVTKTGESVDVNGNVLTSPSLTPLELAERYSKSVTAKVNGEYVGWGYTPSFIRFKARREKEDTIEDITFWHPGKHGEFCRYHIMVLIACGGYTPLNFPSTKLSEEETVKYYTQDQGRNLPKSKTQHVQFKSYYE